jgi:hypothetical protein
MATIWAVRYPCHEDEDGFESFWSTEEKANDRAQDLSKVYSYIYSEAVDVDAEPSTHVRTLWHIRIHIVTGKIRERTSYDFASDRDAPIRKSYHPGGDEFCAISSISREEALRLAQDALAETKKDCAILSPEQAKRIRAVLDDKTPPTDALCRAVKMSGLIPTKALTSAGTSASFADGIECVGENFYFPFRVKGNPHFTCTCRRCGYATEGNTALDARREYGAHDCSENP